MIQKERKRLFVLLISCFLHLSMNLELSNDLMNPVFHFDEDGYCHIDAIGIKEKWSLYNNDELILIGFGQDIKLNSMICGHLVLRTQNNDFHIEK